MTKSKRRSDSLIINDSISSNDMSIKTKSLSSFEVLLVVFHIHPLLFIFSRFFMCLLLLSKLGLHFFDPFLNLLVFYFAVLLGLLILFDVFLARVEVA
jgi:hypothetical protein